MVGESIAENLEVVDAGVGGFMGGESIGEAWSRKCAV